MRALFLCLVVGCVPPPPVYRVQRTARVPHPAVPLRTGEPIAGMAEVSVGASSFADARDPRLVDSTAAVEVPSRQYRGELRLRIRRAEIAGIYEWANGGTMQALDATQAPVDEGNVEGRGAAVRYSIDAGSGLSFGLGLEALAWSIPYVEYRTCVQNCAINDAPQMQVIHGSQSVATLAFAFTPTYRIGRFAFFAGTYARRQPTIVRKGTEMYVDSGHDTDVGEGRYNWLVHGGVEMRLPIVSVLLQIQQDLTRDPVWYGPSLGFALAARLPELHGKPPRATNEPWNRSSSSSAGAASWP